MSRRRTRVKEVDNYAKYADIDDRFASKTRNVDLTIPGNFRMLCAILSVKPKKVISDFMGLVSDFPVENATGKQRSAAQQLFLLCGYGQPQYSRKQINQMFAELKAIRTLRDSTENMDWNDRELFWKSNHMYMQYWFKRWFEMNRRQEDFSVLEKY